jgi:hypothetical protein
MTITLTPLNKKQWAKVGSVCLWLVVSAACAAATAAITKNLFGLFSMPVWNLVGVVFQGIFTQEETAALDHLSPSLQTDVQVLAPELEQTAADVVTSVVEPPVVAQPPVATPATEQTADTAVSEN